MNYVTLKFKKTSSKQCLRKVMTLVSMMGLFAFESSLHGAISTVMNHRLVTSSPLLYKQMDYAHKQASFEIEPWLSGMFDPEHTMANLGINGQSVMTLSQQGAGDINPEWILLAASNADRDYTSTITLDPELFMFGALLHFYKQYDYIFFDFKTAVLNCKTQVKITEVGGHNGGMQDFQGEVLYDAYDAFTQGDWKYGKFGNQESMTGLDNIQFTIGSSGQLGSSAPDHCHMFLAGFGIVEIPTGTGTRGEFLFEPQVGTNHWAFGFGTDFMLVSEDEYSLVAGGNYRYILQNWETRSFDLTENGQWSRYLALDTIADIPGSPVPGLPGINLFTQDALIHGRSQVTAYARLQKRWEHCLFELSYNYFYSQAELITETDTIASGFGIYDIQSGGGLTTASTATIADALDPSQYVADVDPVTLVTSDLDLTSGAASRWGSNTVAARLQHVRGNCNYGFGGSVDIAATQQAMSSWSVWANFELLY